MSILQGPAAMKVTADHLRRTAYLYLRQSTLRRVLANTESTHRHYDLRGRAIALGRAPSRSSSSTATRASQGPTPPHATASTAGGRGEHRPRRDPRSAWGSRAWPITNADWHRRLDMSK
jgi:hypothetical protein